MKKIIIIIGMFLIGVFVSGQIALAFDADKFKGMSDSEVEALNGGTVAYGVANKNVSCFDYYKFQSVQVSMGTDKDSYIPNEVVKLSGIIKNENVYPVVDGNVFVRVSKNNTNFFEEGHYAIDEFIALKNVALNGEEEKKVLFEWEVPEKITAGEYRFDFFFSVGKKFNLGGLPFTNEIIVGSAGFNVDTNINRYISFDRAETTVNGEKYQHIGNWPVLKENQEVKIEQVIKSTFAEDKEVIVKYDLYYWDSLDSKDRIDSKKETIKILGNSKSKVSYIIPKMDKSVYYLKITAITQEGQKSIVNIRVTSNQESPRINYPAITKFPIKKNDNVTLFSCFHNTAQMNTTGQIIVKLLDKEDGEVATINYNGSISSAMAADKVDFQSKKDYEYLKLQAKVYDKDGREVDSYEVIYDCKDLNVCEIKKEISIRSIIVGTFIVLIIATVIVVIIRRNKK